MTTLLSKVRDYLASSKEASTAELVRWVQEPSLAGAEMGVQNQVVDALKNLAMDVKMEYIDSEEIQKDPNFFSPRTQFDTSPNVVGILKGSDPKNGKSLYFLLRIFFGGLALTWFMSESSMDIRMSCRRAIYRNGMPIPFRARSTSAQTRRNSDFLDEV